MIAEIAPLLDEVQAEPPENDHVVVFISDQGIHWRALPQSACDCIAAVLAGMHDCKVMPRAEFIATLESM